MSNRKAKLFLAVFGLILTMGLIFGAASVSAADTLDYASVKYGTKISMPLANHVWRVKVSYLNRAEKAKVTSSDTSVATALIYSNTLKSGYFYVVPRKKGTTTISLDFSYTTSTGKKVNLNRTMKLTVYPYANPFNTVKVGSKDLTALVNRTNYTTKAKFFNGNALIRVTPKKEWTIRGIYVQGLEKSGSTVKYTTKKIANKEHFNFKKYAIMPDLYVVLYSSKQKVTMTVMFAVS